MGKDPKFLTLTPETRKTVGPVQRALCIRPASSHASSQQRIWGPWKRSNGMDIVRGSLLEFFQVAPRGWWNGLC